MQAKERQLRIAIIGDFPIGDVYPRYAKTKSGHTSWLKSLYLALGDENGLDVHWIVIDKKIEQTEQIRHNNQTFHLIPGSRLTIGLYTGYLYNRYLAAKCIRKIQPDIVHGWGTERFYGLVAKDFKGVSLLSVQGLLHACSQRATISTFAMKQRWYEKGTLNGVDYLTAESPWSRDRALELAPQANITVWDYSPDERFFSISRQLTEFPSCILAGTNSPVKNIQTAIKAFSKPELSHVTLYLAGVVPGSIPNLPPNVVPLGRVSRQGMAEYFSKVWCMVHPSLADTGPTVVKEARVAGIPVVISSDCGSKQYIDPGKSGFIIHPTDADALANAVLKMTESAETALTMGAHQLEECRQKLSLRTMREGIVNLYRTIANTSK